MRVFTRMETDAGPRTVVVSGLGSDGALTLCRAAMDIGGDAHVAEDEPGVNLAAFIRGSQIERRKAEKIIVRRNALRVERDSELTRLSELIAANTEAFRLRMQNPAMRFLHGLYANLAVVER